MSRSANVQTTSILHYNDVCANVAPMSLRRMCAGWVTFSVIVKYMVNGKWTAFI